MQREVLGYSQTDRLTENYGTGERRHGDGSMDGIQVGFKHEPRSVASLPASCSLAIRAVNLALNPQLVEPAHTNQEGKVVDILPLNAETDITTWHMHLCLHARTLHPMHFAFKN